MNKEFQRWLRLGDLWAPSDKQINVGIRAAGRIDLAFPVVVPPRGQIVVKEIPKDERREKGPTMTVYLVPPEQNEDGHATSSAAKEAT